MSRGSHDRAETQLQRAPRDTHEAFALIAVAADAVDDLERLRKASRERYRSLTSPEINGERGGWYGKQLPESHPAAVTQLALTEALEDLEAKAVKDLQRAMKQHPLGAFVKETKGLGLKTVARFLAAVGPLEERQTVSQVWAYCGLDVRDGEAPRLRKGEKANWSGQARMRARNMAIPNGKVPAGGVGSKYRDLYEWAKKIKYAGAVHDRQCQNSKRPPNGSNGCGTRDHPEWGEPGSLLRPGHLHARAVRLVAKQMIKDLWIASRRTREGTVSTSSDIAEGEA